jgi:hypothetical protein
VIIFYVTNKNDYCSAYGQCYESYSPCSYVYE